MTTIPYDIKLDGANLHEIADGLLQAIAKIRPSGRHAPFTESSSASAIESVQVSGERVEPAIRALLDECVAAIESRGALPTGGEMSHVHWTAGDVRAWGYLRFDESAVTIRSIRYDDL